MTDLVRIPFHGEDVLAVDVDGKPNIVLKPAIESLGLDYSAQYVKLRGRSWATVALCPMVAEDGRTREMVVVPVRTFLMLLATVDERRVAASVKPRLVLYQAEVADAIEEYWTKGGAINPRASQEQLAAIVDLTTKRMAMFKAAEGIVDAAWLEAKARHELARGIGEEPEIDPATRPLTVGEYLADKGLTATQLRSISSQMGKKLKKAYRTRYNAEPKTVPRFIDGAMRPVAGYTEEHRHLFDAAWAEVSAVRSVS